MMMQKNVKNEERTCDEKHRCKMNNHNINKHTQKPIDDDKRSNGCKINYHNIKTHMQKPTHDNNYPNTHEINNHTINIESDHMSSSMLLCLTNA